MPRHSSLVQSPIPKAKKYTAKDMEHAAESARDMVSDSRVLQACLSAMIASRRLYMIARSALDNEVLHGWDCDDPELIIQTLGASAQDKANEKFEVRGLQQDLLGTVVPFLDIVRMQQQADEQEAAAQAEANEQEQPDNVTSESSGAEEGVPESTSPEVLPGSADEEEG